MQIMKIKIYNNFKKFFKKFKILKNIWVIYWKKYLIPEMEYQK